MDGFMIYFEYKICPNDFKLVTKAIRNVRNEVVRQSKEVPKGWAIDFSKLFMQAILHDKWEPFVTPLAKKYVQKKQEAGYAIPPWKRTLNLLNAISHWKDEKGWKAGIPAGLLGEDGDYIGYYATLIEFGSKDIVERPYLRPEFNEFKQVNYKKRINIAINRIMEKWRK